MWFVLHKVVAINEWHGQILQELDMGCPSCGSSTMEMVVHMLHEYPLA